MKSAADKRTIDGLTSLIKSLGEEGFQRYHIITHSMGARLLSNTLPTLLPLFAKPDDSFKERQAFIDETSPATEDQNTHHSELELATVTMFNPEIELFEFVDGGICQDLIDSGAMITVYGDFLDKPLYASELFNGLYRYMGRRAQRLKLLQG